MDEIKKKPVFFPSFEERNVRGKYQRNWVEDSAAFFSTHSAWGGTPGTRRFMGGGLSQKRLWTTGIGIIIGFVIIVARIGYLQGWKGDYYRALAENNRVRIQPIPSERGIIYDAQGRELVQNVPRFVVSVIPQDLPRQGEDREQAITQLVALSGLGRADILAMIDKFRKRGYESLALREDLDYESALRAYVQNSNIPGIFISKNTKRHYISAENIQENDTKSLSHILGYTGKINDKEYDLLKDSSYFLSDFIGKSGIEQEYEEALRGKYGRRRVEVDARGHEQSVLDENAPIPGKNVYLTINKDAQKKLEDSIAAVLRKTGKKRAAGIVMNVKTGDILALVSLPTYDNNDFSGGISYENYKRYTDDRDSPLFNRAISGFYPSGSTIKLVMSAAALQEGVINRNTTVLSTGGVSVGSRIFKDWKVGGHGVTNVIRALAWSVNTFFYYIGGGYGSFNGLGVDRMVAYMKQFHIGQLTGIDLPEENAGFLPTRELREKKGERWYVGDTYNLAIGQGDLRVTPLQVAVWTAAIANGGKVIQPKVVNKIIDPITKKETIQKSIVLNQVSVAPEHIHTVQEGMRECVLSGSCKLLKGLPFAAAGKTGTAQWNSTADPHAWFTAFAPYDNPQIVITILVEEGGEGSLVAMPIAYNFLQWWGNNH